MGTIEFGYAHFLFKDQFDHMEFASNSSELKLLIDFKNENNFDYCFNPEVFILFSSNIQE